MTVDRYLGFDAGDNRAKPVMIATIPAQNECPGRDLNPHGSFKPGGFKPPVSANFTTRAETTL